jgi:hypothetical protein
MLRNDGAHLCGRRDHELDQLHQRALFLPLRKIESDVRESDHIRGLHGFYAHVVVQLEETTYEPCRIPRMRAHGRYLFSTFHGLHDDFVFAYMVCGRRVARLLARRGADWT